MMQFETVSSSFFCLCRPFLVSVYEGLGERRAALRFS